MTDDRTSDGVRPDPDVERRAWHLVHACLALSAAGSLTFLVAFWADLGTQAEGTSLVVAVGGVGLAFGIWSARIVPERTDVEHRERMGSDRTDRAAVAADATPPDPGPTRRRTLALFAGLSGTGLVVAFLSPLRSFGPSPLPDRAGTPWRSGLRLVDEYGRPVRVDTLERGGIITAFPEGVEDRASTQVVVIRLDPGALDPERTETSWAPDGHVAYSKVCTHAGCPVGLYDEDTMELFCPCHQSVFLATEGARPTFGPAARALPQLPLAVDADGHLMASGDFPEPVGPSYWSRP